MKRRNFIKNSVAISAAASISNFNQSFARTNSSTVPKRIKPNRLKKGDTVGLITPGGYISESDLNDTIEIVESLGFKPYFTDNILAKNGYLAGTDKQRADDINHMFGNEKVNAVLCARGGYGCNRILPMINYDLIRSNPKVLVGYSDITALLYAIFSQTGLVTFHGPVGISTFNEFSVDYFKKVLMHPEEKTIFKPADESHHQDTDDYERYPIRTGKAKGELIGGNLRIAVTLLGTPYDVDYNGKILFLEEVDEKPYRIDRMLTELLLADKLQHVSAVALGVFIKCDIMEGSQKGEESFSLKEVFYDRLFELNVPVIYGLSFGHISNKFTIPFGIEAEIDVLNEALTLQEPAVL